jgi:hypothetical protein
MYCHVWGVLDWIIGFIGTSLQLHAIITAHTLNPFLATSVRWIPMRNLSLLSEYRTGPYCFDLSTALWIESYVTTDGQPASLSWNKAPFWGLRPDIYYCLTVACLNSKSKSHCDWRSVSLSVCLVSSPGWGSWPVVSSCLKITVLSMWGALSDER